MVYLQNVSQLALLNMVQGPNHMGIAEIGSNVNQIDDVLGSALARFAVNQLHLHPRN